MALSIDGKIQIMNGVSAVGSSASYAMDGEGLEIVEAYGTTLSGNGSAVIEIQVSNDNVNWLTAGKINLYLSTTQTTDKFTMDASWEGWLYVRANVVSIVGTSASISVYKITGAGNVDTAQEHMREHLSMHIANGTNVPTGWFDILPYWDLANISGDTAAGLTASVDYDVTFAGRPTVRIDIPAGTSGAKSLLGTTGATAYIPNPWDLKNLCVAVRCTNTAIFPSLSQTIGDAALTNRWNKDKTKEGHPDGYSFPNRNNEWCFLKCGSLTDPAAIAVTAGSPVVANRMRAKFATSLTSSASNESMWIGFFGILPARRKPTVIISMDDGYLTWYDFIRPLAKYYNIPVSMSIVGSLLGTGNKMSIAQAQALASDSSRLFDFTNHTYDHLTLVAGVNEALQVENFKTNRDFMRNTLGVIDDGPLHLIYPGGVTSLAQYAQVKAAGFLTGRKNQLCWMHGQDQTLASGEDDGRFVQNIVTVLDNTKTIADVKTAVDGIVTRNEVGILEGHNSAAASATDTWARQNYEELFADLAARRDAGTIEVKSISRWYADLTGRPCSLL